jgi:biopolymer transport protein ExbB
MRSRPLFLLFCLFVSIGAAPDKNQKEKELQQQLSSLKVKLQDARETLQNQIAERWGEKQRFIEKREIDKEELERLAEQQEKAFGTVASIKEEIYSLERRLEEAGKELEDKKQEWNYVRSVLEDILQKESDEVSSVFPTDMEQERKRVESLRSSLLKDGNIIAATGALTACLTESAGTGSRLSISRQTLFPEGGEPVLMTVARFGNVFGYGMAEDGSLYSIAQTGREGIDRYKTIRIENPELKASLTNAFGSWIETGVPGGIVPVDVLQNENSKMLATGKAETAWVRLKAFLIAGGPVMVPLCLLPLWALILVIIKLVQFAGKRSRNAGIYRKVEEYLNNSDREGALKFLEKKGKGAAVKIARTCLKNSSGSRKGAEEAVKEVLMKEMPGLASHLNTLAVIAAVAPLLGLLGTVTGMISLFEVITRFGTGDPKLLAGGISEALITTEVGLIVAIPILLIHNYLRNRKNRISSDLQLHAMSLINRLYPEGETER